MLEFRDRILKFRDSKVSNKNHCHISSSRIYNILSM